MKRLLVVLIAICTIAVIGFGFVVKVEAARADSAATLPKLSCELPTVVTRTNDMPCLGDRLSQCVQDFAWRSFFALNCPANEMGRSIGDIKQEPDAPRVWEFYPRLDEVFPPKGQQPNRTLAWDRLDRDVPIRAMFSKSQALLGNPAKFQNPILDPTGFPLVDQTNNYVLYDIRINPIEAEQIITNHWYNTQCLEKLTDNLDLRDRSLEIKTAWRILSYFDSKDREIPIRDNSGQEVNKDLYYTVKRQVRIPKENIYPHNHEANNLVTLELGLISFHIAYKVPIVQSNGRKLQWVWATFEHIDNAPPRLLPPQQESERPYTLHNRSIECEGSEAGQEDSNCNTLQAREPYYFNTIHPPSAVTETGKAQTPTQVVREGNLAMTQRIAINPWQEQLQNTVWYNYQMRGTGVQWQKSDLTHPRLANSAIETYVQKEKQSCFQCHRQAKLLQSKKFPLADFSFLFEFNAKSYPDESCSVENPLPVND